MKPDSFILPERAAEMYATLSDVRPLRIAMLSIHSSPLGKLGKGDTGGMSVYIRELSEELGKAGCRVDIYTCASDGSREAELSISENVRLIHLLVGREGHVRKNSLYARLPEVFQSLDAYITSNRLSYDLIHSHYWMSGIVGRLAQNRWSTPHVVMFHTTGMAKRVACGGEREPVHRLISERRLALTSDRIFTATSRERDLLVRYYNAPAEKTRMLPCGVNLERFRPVSRDLARQEVGLRGTGAIVLYVGRFAPVKGLDRLIAAAGHLRSRRGLEFVVIGGDGPGTDAFTELQRLVRKTSTGSMVRFLGRVEHDLLPLYYSAADVLVVPSYYESFGLVGLEALACGTPVIAGRVGAMDTLIKDGRSGIVLDNPSPHCLADAIERSISAPSWMGASREEIRASVLGYSWNNIASAVLTEYVSVVRPCVSRK